jgi:GT2 family glycosyltransferase
MSPLVSVVVVNLNRKDLLGQCLDSIWQQQFQDFEVVVVDNGSNDGSLDYLYGISSDRLRIVALPENLGFAGGANAGIRLAHSRYVATLNNDAEAEPGWLGALVDCLEENPQVGMAASKILFAGDRGRIDKVGHLIYPDGLNHGRGSGELDLGQFDKTEEVLFPDGAAALYRKKMLDQVGLFDERFFAYGDDADLGLRGRLAGWTCIYVPEAQVSHVHSATAGEFSPFKAYLIERNRLWVAVKLWPLPLLMVSPLFTAVRFAFHAYGALSGTGSSGRFASDVSRRALVMAIFRAYWSGLGQLGGILRSRREIRRFQRLGDIEFMRLIWEYRISLRALTLGS